MKYLVKFLRTYNGAGANELKSVAAEAEQLVAYVPFLFVLFVFIPSGDLPAGRL